MNYSQYQDLFEEIINQSAPSAPYDNKHYMENVKVNQAQMKKWDESLALSDELIEELKGIQKRQHWIIISEPWCMEAGHIVPFLVRMSAENDLISYDIQLRDSEPFLINSYLTRGGKGIPKMVARDENGHDLFVWGPRPADAQAYRDSLSASNQDSAAIGKALKQWYQADQGRSLNTEILQHCMCTIE